MFILLARKLLFQYFAFILANARPVYALMHKFSSIFEGCVCVVRGCHLRIWCNEFLAFVEKLFFSYEAVVRQMLLLWYLRDASWCRLLRSEHSNGIKGDICILLDNMLKFNNVT